MQHDKTTRLMHFSDDERSFLDGCPTPVNDTQAARLLKIAAATAQYYADELSRLYNAGPFDSAARQMDIVLFSRSSALSEELVLQLTEAQDHALTAAPAPVPR